MIEYQITMDDGADRATAPLTIAFMPPQIGAGERVVYGIWSSPSHDLAQSPSGPFYLRKWYSVEERIRGVGPGGGARGPRIVWQWAAFFFDEADAPMPHEGTVLPDAETWPWDNHFLMLTGFAATDAGGDIGTGFRRKLVPDDPDRARRGSHGVPLTKPRPHTYAYERVTWKIDQ